MLLVGKLPAGFIERCIKRRKELKLSQKELGNRLGLSQQSIARFEKGENNNAVIALEYVRMGVEI